MANTHTNEPLPIRLARYLKEFVGLRTTTVRDIDKYESVLWFHSIPQERDCQSPAWNDGLDPGEAWLEVRKQNFRKPPEPPSEIVEWIDERLLTKAAPDMPALRPSIFVPGSQTGLTDDEMPPLVESRLADHPEVTRAYETFRPTWEAWSAEHRRREGIQGIYAELFRLHTQVRKQGELQELILGLGFLKWTAQAANGIRRHVVTAKVDLHFDPASAVIQLRPTTDRFELQIEDDMLEAEARPVPGQYAAFREQLEEIAEGVWDKPRMHTALRSWATALHSDSNWSPELEPSEGSVGSPTLSFAPALILRTRTQAGMLRIYQEIIARLSSGTDEVPAGWRRLVQDEDDADSGVTWPTPPVDGPAPPREPAETYFPLPANREQRRIVEAINERKGVLVQGPPGTGKSHTIANLVCHLLATGKRVLITAETARALKVLKEKLPTEIQDLCVSMLGQGGDEFAELNTAIQGITRRQAAYTPGVYDERITEIERDLDHTRRSIAKIDTELRGLREGETHAHSVAGGVYKGSASSIAARVSSERSSFGWLQLPRDAGDEPPLLSEQAAVWLTILRRYDDGAVEQSRLQIPECNRIPTPSSFAQLAAVEQEARAAVERSAKLRGHRAYAPATQLSEQLRAQLAETLQVLERRRRTLERRSGEWRKRAVADLLEGGRTPWAMLHERSKELVSRIGLLLERVGARAVSLPKSKDPRVVRADAEAAVAHLKSGGKWRTWGVFTPKILKERKYLAQDVTVDGLPALTAELMTVVCDRLDLATALGDLDRAWGAHGGLAKGRDATLRFGEAKDRLSDLAEVLEYGDACRETGLRMAAASPPIPEPNWLADELEEWRAVLEAVALEKRQAGASMGVSNCARELQLLVELHDAHPVVRHLIHAVERRDVTAYSEGYATVRAIEQARVDLELRRRTEETLHETAPGVVGKVVGTLNEPFWDGRLASWEGAWRWAVADNWLQKRSDASYHVGLQRQRRDAELALGQLIAEMAALRAWTFFFSRLSTQESAALRGWREAVKAMGKGTGQSAKQARLRREARAYMDKCRDAIPVWIMPRYLVAEMLDPAPNRYDLVIVDEASQLGIESLFLFYIAKKLVVVGDDQQISPAGVGVADEAIAALQHHYLRDMPHRVALSPQSSLYANARIRFGQNIVLREHFRCMPEIIQFSNDLCYASNGTPLDALRAYPANRMMPLVLRHVSDGYRVGGPQHAQNEPEADAIVAQIVACVGDERYAKCTMGVISLQGEAQAKLIERKLLDVLDPVVIEERQLICGDAYAFQGDERDVIFLSMVAAPNERIGVLSGDPARQRFNVAASRARDQLWLFHTATLDVLSISCMRHRLLSYMLNPVREIADERELRFESDFERDVYRHLAAREFLVRTQVSVGDRTNHRYRIDLVVEGMQGRLAIECDGDRWHGPDRYEQDMSRQRDLERAGWQFVRIRGGEFYRDQPTAMARVWAELDRLGIRSGGIDEAAAEPPVPNATSVSAAAADNDIPREAEDDVPNGGADVSVQLAFEHDAHATDADQGREQPNAAHLIVAVGIPPAVVLRTGLADGFVQPLTSVLVPYVSYEGVAGPDPRTGSANAIAQGLVKIIEVEGPMCAKRAYDTYLQGCGIRRLGGEIQRAMNRALASAIKQGLVVSEDENARGGLIWSIVRRKGTPAVRARARGPRVFEEIPPSEIQSVAHRVAKDSGVEFGSDAHLRMILTHFDLVRLTAQVQSGLKGSLNRRFAYVDDPFVERH